MLSVISQDFGVFFFCEYPGNFPPIPAIPHTPKPKLCKAPPVDDPIVLVREAWELWSTQIASSRM